MTKGLSRALTVAPLALALVLSTVHTAGAEPDCTQATPGPRAAKGVRMRAVKIVSAPPGAEIQLGAGCPPTGVTPWEGKLAPGSYTVILKLPGYEETSKPFKVSNKTRRVQELFVPLIKKVGPPAPAPTPAPPAPPAPPR